MLSIANSQVPPPSNWHDFENLCWLLWRSEWSCPEIQKHGRQGQAQNGVDVYGQAGPKKKWYGIQCKGKDTFTSQALTASELRKEVKNASRFRPRLSHFIVATTAPRDVAIQTLARKITSDHKSRGEFSVHVCSWDDIRLLLDAHPDVVDQLYYGAAFAKDTRRYFDGIEQIRTLIAEYDVRIRQLHALFFGADGAKSLRTESPELLGVTGEQIAQIDEILKGKPRQGSQRISSTRSRTARVLSAKRLHALGVISVSPMPFSPAALQSVLNQIDWRNELRYFKRHGLVTSHDGKYSVPPEVARQIGATEEELLPYLEEWIPGLERLRSYPDIALFLSMQLMRAGRVVESVNNLVEAAQIAFPGKYNDTYLSILQAMDCPKMLRRLKKHDKVRFINSLALCHYRAGNHSRSIRTFERLRRLSKQFRDSWGIGQSFHNCGIVYLEMSDLKKAEECFCHSVAHTRKTRDKFLLGRSLYELAVTVSQTSIERAGKLFAESEKIKRRLGDIDGLLGVYHGRAVMSIQRRDVRTARKWFAKAEQAAKRIGNFHAEALERYNVGKCHFDLGEYDEAIPHLREAKRMAEADDLPDVLILAVGAEAMVCANSGNFRAAEVLFKRLVELQLQTRDHTAAVISLHDIGACLMEQHKYSDARQALKRAAEFARENSDQDWAYQSQADLALCHKLEGYPQRAISSLRRMVNSEQRHGDRVVAAKLQLDIVKQLTEDDHSIKQIFADSAKCRKLVGRSAKAATVKMQLLLLLHTWHWQNQRFDQGVKSLEELHTFATALGDRNMACQALNQIGICLHELNRDEESVLAARGALQLARTLQDSYALETCLNNLGELLRALGKYSEAIDTLEKAEKLARARQDQNDAMSIAHNRALALQHMQNFEAADEIFRRCLVEGKRCRNMHEFVRALHAIANLSWNRSRPRIAENQYVRALEAADQFGSSFRHEICLNYSNALAWNGKTKKAVQVLTSAEDEFKVLPNAHLYYSHLASLYVELNDGRKAKSNWTLAIASAELANDSEALANCHAAIAELNDHAGRLKDAYLHYNAALHCNKDPLLRLSLLCDHIGVLLRLKSKSKALQLLEELRLLAHKHLQYADYLDALCMMGDYFWTDGKSAKDALKAHVAAMTASSLVDISRFFEIGFSTALRLVAMQEKRQRDEITRLKSAIDRWLKDDQDMKVRREIVLWPFTAAQRISTLKKSNKSLAQATIKKILEEEVESVLPPSRRSISRKKLTRAAS